MGNGGRGIGWMGGKGLRSELEIDVQHLSLKAQNSLNFPISPTFLTFTSPRSRVPLSPRPCISLNQRLQSSLQFLSQGGNGGSAASFVVGPAIANRNWGPHLEVSSLGTEFRSWEGGFAL